MGLMSMGEGVRERVSLIILELYICAAWMLRREGLVGLVLAEWWRLPGDSWTLSRLLEWLMGLRVILTEGGVWRADGTE